MGFMGFCGLPPLCQLSPPWAQCHYTRANVDARKIKVAVLGAGSLGKEHVRIYADLAAAGVVWFAGIYDVASEPARKLAEKYHVRLFDSIKEAADASDALNIVTPTTTHYEI